MPTVRNNPLYVSEVKEKLLFHKTAEKLKYMLLPRKGDLPDWSKLNITDLA
jgi:hypothetical protein